jgi:hypothetical protein
MEGINTTLPRTVRFITLFCCYCYASYVEKFAAQLRVTGNYMEFWRAGLFKT